MNIRLLGFVPALILVLAAPYEIWKHRENLDTGAGLSFPLAVMFWVFIVIFGMFWAIGGFG